ncbi:MAG: hypothetical protein H6739_30885 [Alphaproteobacteria bacterium]|nr:hypothetical protein [Alphaproteobacteria bacterium]
MKTLLLAILLASPPAPAQEPPPDRVVDTGAPDEGVEAEAEGTPDALEAERQDTITRKLGFNARQRAQQDAALEEAAAQRNRRLLLIVIVLLLMFLLSRSVNRRDPRAGQRRRRRAPVSHDELGRLVFQAARDADLRTYRSLFLNGSEAAALMGREQAQLYLSSRDAAALEDALAELAARIPAGAVFSAVRAIDGGLMGLNVRSPNGDVVTIPVGTVTDVGGVQRIHLPAALAPRFERVKA